MSELVIGQVDVMEACDQTMEMFGREDYQPAEIFEDDKAFQEFDRWALWRSEDSPADVAMFWLNVGMLLMYGHLKKVSDLKETELDAMTDHLDKG